MITATTTLVCLHGFSQNGALLEEHLHELTARLSGISSTFPDAPHECSEENVARLSSLMDGQRSPSPHRCFWNATDDGREYRGWPESLAMLRAHVASHVASNSRIGLLGFSQGAIAAAALCALAAHGQFPELAFAVLVAGRKPRSELLAPLFEAPIAVPSLHVWGERDPFAVDQSPLLLECFDPTTREQVIWRGPHIVPTRGPVADAIVDFIGRHSPA